MTEIAPAYVGALVGRWLDICLTVKTYHHLTGLVTAFLMTIGPFISNIRRPCCAL